MNLRQLKRITCARMAHDLFYNRPIGQWMTAGLGALGQEQPSWVGHGIHELHALAALTSKTVVVDNLSEQLEAEMTREVPLPFVCKKVKDDEAVGSFDTREEAFALVAKHAKQKKAKLYVTQGDMAVDEEVPA